MHPARGRPRAVATCRHPRYLCLDGYSEAVVTQVQRRMATRQAIVDAAICAYLEDPQDEPSLDAIAERAGVAKSTVLYHFENRLGLLEAVAQRLYHEMGQRLGPLEQYPDAAAFVRAFLLDGMEPSTRVFRRVGDQLAYASSGTGIGRGLRSLIKALEAFGVSDRVLVIASAAQMMARQVTFERLDDAAVDRFVQDLFEEVPAATSAQRGRGTAAS